MYDSSLGYVVSQGLAEARKGRVSGKPIKLVGRGERIEDLEPFYPDRMAGRILGMGDVLSFVEKAQEVMQQEDAEELQKKIMSAKFDFNDFLKQTRAVAKMGSVSRVIGMIPGMGKATPAQIREAEKNLKVMEAMIEAMTPEEREKPELLAESPVRRKRVAQDSGKTEQQVSQLVAQLFQMRVRMKNLMGVMQGGSIPTLSNLEEALKTEEKFRFHLVLQGGRRDRNQGNNLWNQQGQRLVVSGAKTEPSRGDQGRLDKRPSAMNLIQSNMGTDETFPAADVAAELNPGNNTRVQVDPVSSEVAAAKEIQEQAEAEDKKKERRKKEALQKLKSGIIISAVVVAVAGAAFAIAKKLREK
ncbi:hypothetical protein Ahy_A06g028200 isoform D [Arachis hypogaea]|uniref:SRP54-type proteins GTP-binding domain-containing protein n=1 Tax=Arachis hypogaea TaxID=3818 RepID=A0A445CQI4_ARAHY|nr:hypothetical protein Ahy_A06g028200 isoform D [Arachis hypogaea]